MQQTLNLTQEWDKTFPKSNIVDHKKVTFHNRYGITLAADMYTPKAGEGKFCRHCRLRTFRCRQRAVQRFVCADTGRKRIPDECLRSLVLW
jgi:hypothetical protein